MKRLIPTFVVVLPLLLSFSSCSSSKLDKIHTPITFDSDLTPTKLDTHWSRLTLGRYPGREIVGSAFTNVLDYAYEESDVKLDAALYSRLSSSTWESDELTLDGVAYKRMLEPATPLGAQHYTYDDPGKKYHYFEIEPISWRVLALDGSKATLMADKALECFPYHPNESGPGWKGSYVRSFLNSLDKNENQTQISFKNAGFLDKAFSEKERKALIKRSSVTTVNPDYDISSGDPTEDYVYLLDNDEMYDSDTAKSYGFYKGHGYDDPAKRFKSTMYAKFQGCWFSPVQGYRGNCFHFMRTPGYKTSYASYICDFGYIYSRGTSQDCFDAGIIPVINVDLNRTDWGELSERYSSAMMQKTSSDGFAESAGQGKWKTVEYGSYPQSEVKASDERYAKLSAATWTDDETVLDCIRYRHKDNHYYQYEPISWRILEQEGDEALLFASSGLDCHPFHNQLTNLTWSTSDVRRYLNDEFFNMAFADNHQAVIQKTNPNPPNHYFGTDCGPATEDKVFLLCEDDIFGEGAAAKHGFAPSDATTDEGRRIIPTDYAKGKGAWVSKQGNGFYSLRNSGYSNANAVYIGEQGDVYNRGIPVTCSDMTLVPAIWANLSLLG